MKLNKLQSWVSVAIERYDLEMASDSFVKLQANKFAEAFPGEHSDLLDDVELATDMREVVEAGIQGNIHVIGNQIERIYIAKFKEYMLEQLDDIEDIEAMEDEPCTIELSKRASL